MSFAPRNTDVSFQPESREKKVFDLHFYQFYMGVENGLEIVIRYKKIKHYKLLLFNLFKSLEEQKNVKNVKKKEKL